jgi:uncharacterized membrane protein (DUF2068 family)
MDATSKPGRHSDYGLIAIGIFKLVKSTLLFALGMVLICYRDEGLGTLASHWISKLWLSRAYFNELIIKLSLLSPQTIDRCTVASFFYAVLLAIEGIGLCLRKRWAEYLTVGITASLLPFEFYELAHRVTLSGIVITLLNLAILLYLVIRLFKNHRQPRGLHA